jgi:hypothetical protein
LDCYNHPLEQKQINPAVSELFLSFFFFEKLSELFLSEKETDTGLGIIAVPLLVDPFIIWILNKSCTANNYLWRKR